MSISPQQLTTTQTFPLNEQNQRPLAATLLAAILILSGFAEGLGPLLNISSPILWAAAFIHLSFGIGLHLGKRWSWFFTIFLLQVQLLSGLVICFFSTQLGIFLSVSLSLISATFLAIFFKDNILGYYNVRTDLKGFYLVTIPFVGAILSQSIAGIIYLIIFFSVAIKG